MPKNKPELKIEMAFITLIRLTQVQPSRLYVQPYLLHNGPASKGVKRKPRPGFPLQQSNPFGVGLEKAKSRLSPNLTVGHCGSFSPLTRSRVIYPWPGKWDVGRSAGFALGRTRRKNP